MGSFWVNGVILVYETRVNGVILVYETRLYTASQKTMAQTVSDLNPSDRDAQRVDELLYCSYSKA